MPVGSIIRGGAGIISGLIDSRTSKKNVQRQITARKNMAEYGYEKDLEMWNRQNIYNMPSSQMARLKQAGLNPNLVYGTGTVTGNTGGQMPKYNQPQLDYEYKPPQLAENLQRFGDFGMKQAQTKNIDADTISKLVDAKVNAATVDEQIVERHQQAAEQTHVTRLKQLERHAEVRKQPYYKQAAAAEITEAQGDARSAVASATLKEIEVEIYKALKIFGAGTQGGQFLNSILRTLVSGKKGTLKKGALRNTKSVVKATKSIKK